MNYPVLLSTHYVERAYGVEAYPITVYIDRNGSVAGVNDGSVLSAEEFETHVLALRARK